MHQSSPFKRVTVFVLVLYALILSRRGPALGGWDLRFSVEKPQICVDVPLSSRPSVHCVPQVHGSMTLTKRHRTIYFRTENSIVAEQERDNKVDFCCARCDVAAEHENSRCASLSHPPRSPALSVPGVPASQASSRVDVRPRSTCSLPTRRAARAFGRARFQGASNDSRRARGHAAVARRCRPTVRRSPPSPPSHRGAEPRGTVGSSISSSNRRPGQPAQPGSTRHGRR